MAIVDKAVLAMTITGILFAVGLWVGVIPKHNLEETEYHLYAMDYKYKDHHKQFYIVATDGGLAQEAARESGYEITSMRKIKIPILVVR